MPPKSGSRGQSKPLRKYWLATRGVAERHADALMATVVAGLTLAAGVLASFWHESIQASFLSFLLSPRSGTWQPPRFG